jgi:ferric-dicitrate binding protein FerR (iron transport regulator)
MSDPDEIARRARSLLDRSTDELDAATRARLGAARAEALAALRTPRPLWARRRALVVAAAAFGAAALAFGASWWLRAPAGPLSFGDDVDDVDILAGTDDLEMYDDLEFYRWLDDEPI